MWPPLLGQEAAQVGSAHAVREADVVFPSYREHAVAMVLGVPLTNLLGLFRGVDGGDWQKLNKFKNYQIVIGCQALHATGYAMGHPARRRRRQRQRRRQRAAVIKRSLRRRRLQPRCDVNEARCPLPATTCPGGVLLPEQPVGHLRADRAADAHPLFQRAQGFGFPGVRVDGNDVLQKGPSPDLAMIAPDAVKAHLHRGVHLPDGRAHHLRRPHWAPPGLRRRAVEVAATIARLTTYLQNEGAIDDDWLAAVDEEAKQFGADVRASIHTLKDKTMDELFDSVYAENTVALEAQRREYADYVAGFGERR